MAIQKIRMRPEGTNDYADVLHPETTASQVIEETNKKFMTDAEKTKLTNIPANPKYTDTITTINGKTGAISKADIVALGIPASDTNTVYTHPTTAGNKHVPTGGSAGQILGYGSSSGTATWVNPPSASEIITDFNTTLANKITITIPKFYSYIEIQMRDMLTNNKDYNDFHMHFNTYSTDNKIYHYNSIYTTSSSPPISASSQIERNRVDIGVDGENSGIYTSKGQNYIIRIYQSPNKHPIYEMTYFNGASSSRFDRSLRGICTNVSTISSISFVMDKASGRFTAGSPIKVTGVV